MHHPKARKRTTSDGRSSMMNSNNNSNKNNNVSPIPLYHNDSPGEDRTTMIHRGGGGSASGGGKFSRSSSCTDDGGNSPPRHHQEDDALLLSSLLHPALSTDDDDEHHHGNKRPQRGILHSIWNTNHCFSTTRRRRGSKVRCCCAMILLALLLSVLVIEKMVFAVRYVTMGRPAFLYGSPMDWEDVKGCLSSTWEQEVAEYKDKSMSRTSSSSSSSLQQQLDWNPDIVWTWHRYSNDSSSNNSTIHSTNKAKRRLLIAQYSGFGSYTQILNNVAPVNRAYARKWGHDFVTLEGTALKFPGLRYSQDKDHGDDTNDDDAAPCPGMENGYEAQSTFNKIPLLFRALEKTEQHSSYDQVLILDTDTMIVDLDYDITTLLLPSNGDDDSQQHQHDDVSNQEYFVAAYRVWWNDWHWTWDINAGITLWNLNHPTTRQVAETWLQTSLTHPKDVLLKNDDQFFLQRALMSLGWWRRMREGVRTVREELEYYDATLIKHFKRDARSWTRTSLEQRLLRIQEAKEVVCEQWPQDCQLIQDEDATAGNDNT